MNWLAVKDLDQDEIVVRWNEMLRTSDRAAQYVSPAFFSDPFAGSGERLAFLSFAADGSVDGAMTGIRTGDSFESGLPTRPQIAYANGADCSQVAGKLIEAATSSGIKTLRFYSWEAIDHADLFETAKTAEHEVVVLDLTGGADAVFKGFSQTRRNELRRAEKEGRVSVAPLASRDEMLELYQIHLDWNRRKGTEAQPLESFEAATLHSPSRVTLVAKSEGKVIAGSFYRYLDGSMIEYAANHSLTEYQKLRPNDLLTWNAIKWACERGFTQFSMGGAHLFLRRFGGEIVTTHGYLVDRTFLRRSVRLDQLSSIRRRAAAGIPPKLKARLAAVTRALD